MRAHHSCDTRPHTRSTHLEEGEQSVQEGAGRGAMGSASFPGEAELRAGLAAAEESGMGVDAALVSLSRRARLVGALGDAEEALERLAELRFVNLERLEAEGVSEGRLEGVMLDLAEAYHWLGNLVRIQLTPARNRIIFLPRNKARAKKGPFDDERFVLYNDEQVQDNLKSLLGSRVSKAEELLVRALELRRYVLQERLQAAGASNSTGFVDDASVMECRTLVAQTLNALSVLQHTYGLETADEPHIEALNMYASLKATAESDFCDGTWVFDPERHVWEQLSPPQKDKTRKHRTQDLSEFEYQTHLPFRLESPYYEQDQQHSSIGRSLACAFLGGRHVRRRRSESSQQMQVEAMNPLAKKMLGEHPWRLVLIDKAFQDWIDRNAVGSKKKRLVLEARELATTEVELDPIRNKEYLIRKASVAAKSKFLNKSHALFTFDNRYGHWCVEDRSAKTNGILVNGVRVRQVALGEGDMITFGGVGSNLKFGELANGFFEGNFSSPLVYRVERLWTPFADSTQSTTKNGEGEEERKGLQRNLVPEGVLLLDPDEDQESAHFHALVVSEYMRQSISGQISPNQVALGVSKKESKSLYLEAIENLVPMHLWSVFIHMKTKQKAADHFIRHHRNRELRYLGL